MDLKEAIDLIDGVNWKGDTMLEAQRLVCEVARSTLPKTFPVWDVSCERVGEDVSLTIPDLVGDRVNRLIKAGATSIRVIRREVPF